MARQPMQCHQKTYAQQLAISAVCSNQYALACLEHSSCVNFATELTIGFQEPRPAGRASRTEAAADVGGQDARQAKRRQVSQCKSEQLEVAVMQSCD